MGDPPLLHGLDIETDTEAGGLDPRTACITAVAVASDGGTRVFDGAEADLLRALDVHVAALPAGVIVTWNGAAFDLPFLFDRAQRGGPRPHRAIAGGGGATTSGRACTRPGRCARR